MVAMAVNAATMVSISLDDIFFIHSAALCQSMSEEALR